MMSITASTVHFRQNSRTHKHYFKLHLMPHDYYICRDAMRSGCSEDDLLALIGAAVRKKKQQHAGKQHDNPCSTSVPALTPLTCPPYGKNSLPVMEPERSLSCSCHQILP